jgi:hypothetical protein
MGPNAQLTARSNVGDFTACFCSKGANITESGGAVCYAHSSDLSTKPDISSGR